MHPCLPIFDFDLGGRKAIYTPGLVAVVEESDGEALKRAWSAGRDFPEAAPAETAVRILRAAESVESRRNTWLERAYLPECLTIYLSTACNLECSYCYVDRRSASRPPQVIDSSSVAAAALTVARCCASKGVPFHLVLHGGGEPTVHWNLVLQYYALTRRVADEHGLPWFGHIATNGVLPEKRAKWLGRHFSHVGLSCDGPAIIQQRQRPLAGGGASTESVERTARAVAEEGGKLEVRATITPATMVLQEEILDYLVDSLGARQIRFEPVYRQPDGKGFGEADADSFAAHFIAAQALARRRGADLSIAGVRVDDVHGPHCEVLRQVLHLTPQGHAAACFFCTDSGKDGTGSMVIGRPDRRQGVFLFDDKLIARHRRCAGRLPARCASCPASHHCSRACPEVCVLDRADGTGGGEAAAFPGAAAFRCRLHRALTEAWVISEAGKVGAAPTTVERSSGV
jgi:uncharacterized protein